MTTATEPNSSTAIAERGSAEVGRPVDGVRRALELLKPQMAMALPRHLTPERLVRVAMTAIQNTPKLLECNRTSLFAAIMTCAQLGLEPDGVLGQAYLVPFAGKVQFIPGYKGLISLARNSGEVVSISAHEVCKKDHFEYAFGLNERLEHIPAQGDRGEVIAFYAIAKFKDGGHHFDVMSKSAVDTIRDGSSGYKNALRFAKAGQDPQTPWVQNYVEMGKKSAIRRIAKYLPMNVQKAAAIADMYDSGRHAELGEAGELKIDPERSSSDVIDVSPEPESNGLDTFASATELDNEKDETPATSQTVLISSERAMALRHLAEERGLDAEALCSEISGAGIESTPASFDVQIVREIEKRGSTKKSAARR